MISILGPPLSSTPFLSPPTPPPGLDWHPLLRGKELRGLHEVQDGGRGGGHTRQCNPDTDPTV